MNIKVEWEDSKYSSYLRLPNDFLLAEVVNFFNDTEMPSHVIIWAKRCSKINFDKFPDKDQAKAWAGQQLGVEGGK